MTDRPPRDPDAAPLAYAPPARPVFNKRQFRVGLLASLVTCGVCFGAMFFAGVHYYENEQRPPTVARVTLGTTAVALVLLTLLGFRAQRRSGSRGYLVGVILGIGLSALPLGLCFYVLGSSAVGA